MTPTAIVAYLVLFATVGFLFLFASLLLGKFLRAHSPTPMKLEVYECGEPAVGPGTVQFDLRFYVVALVFLVFEVEVAMFFPTATIFGKATRILNPSLAVTVAQPTTPAELASASEPAPERVNPTVVQTYRELGVPMAATPVPTAAIPASECRGVAEQVKSQFQMLALAAMLDLGVFFAVLLVGFAFVWNRGDLNWVRAIHHPPTPIETAAFAQQLRSDNSR